MLCYITCYVIQIMLYDITTYVMLYNMCYGMSYNMCYVMLYKICYMTYVMLCYVI